MGRENNQHEEEKLMSEAVQAQAQLKSAKKESSTFSRVFRYTLIRSIMLLFTVVVAIFLTIMIANMGGKVDEMQRGMIREDVSQLARDNKALQGTTTEVRMEWINEQVRLREHQQGLDQPFMTRTVKFMTNALNLNLGRALRMTSAKGSQMVRDVILERLPTTLVLFGTSGLLLFFGEIFVALMLSRRYGSFADKLFVTLAPSSAAPAWFYGLFLILFFASYLKVLPFGGMMDAPVPQGWVGYSLSLIRHMILPIFALTLSQFAINVYTWRTFFMIYSSEDYVEMAKAKGLPSRMIESDYVLRPTLPTIVTAFALTLIGLWQGFIVTETVFSWPGMGRAYFQAIQFYDTPVIVGMTIIYAYLLMITVLVLDFIYALIDPRVKVGDKGGQS
jgi:peptide/nickel transport system permease protein